MKRVRLSFTANLVTRVTIKVVVFTTRNEQPVWEVVRTQPGLLDVSLLVTPNRYEALSYFQAEIDRYI